MVYMLSASNAAAGGFEASRLDTKFMYEEGNYAEFSNATINYDVKPSNLTLPAAAGGPVYKTESSVRDQKRVAMAFKSRVGNLDIGLTDFQSGTIQLEGAAATLRKGGYVVTAENMAGNPESVIADKVLSEGFDLVVMGAYGHSRIRNLIIGSTTTEMVRSCMVPVLLFH